MSEVLKFKDIESWDAATIDSKVEELRRAIFTMKMKKTTVGLETPHVLKILKKNIARLLTARNLKGK